MNQGNQAKRETRYTSTTQAFEIHSDSITMLEKLVEEIVGPLPPEPCERSREAINSPGSIAQVVAVAPDIMLGYTNRIGKICERLRDAFI